MDRSIPHVVDVPSTLGPSRASSTVARVVPVDHRVTALTSLGDDVFVFFVRSQSPQVDVYNAATFTLKHSIPIPGRMSVTYGLAACAYNNCLYASDYVEGRVHRVSLSGGKAAKTWRVAGGPMHLTVNGAKNVLVVVRDERKLQEFTTHGKLLRTIRLDLEKPGPVVQLSSGQFVVSHSTDTLYGHNTDILHRVCLLDDKGAVVRSYGSPEGSDLTKMKCPAGLAVDEKGNILVADCGNDRLLVLDPFLTSARQMTVSVGGGLKEPFALCFDASRGRLLICECLQRRTIVVVQLKDFTASQTA